MPVQIPIGQCATIACLLEANAPKPGNVHRIADFEDLRFPDLLLSAVAIGPAMERAAASSVGATILAAVRATRSVVATNSNLGTILLLAPLAAVPRDQPLRSGVVEVLGKLGREDARLVYEAIRLAKPGGLGKVDAGDVADEPPENLLTAMQLAAERDLVAREYTNGFDEVLTLAAPTLAQGLEAAWPIEAVIVHAFITIGESLAR